MMIFYSKGDKTDISPVFDDAINYFVTYEDLEDIKLAPGALVAKMISTSLLTSMYGYDKEGIDELIYCVLKSDSNLISSFLGANKHAFESMNIHFIKKYIKAYQKLNNIEDPMKIIECTKDNFMETIDFISKLTGNYSLYSRNMSLFDYYTLFKENDISKYGDIVIDYQECTSPITIRELSEVANNTFDIIELAMINDLSPLEQIILVYDRIKRREYKENKEDLYSARDIDKVIKSGSIVCLGYANLFSAILSALNIENKVMTNYKHRHARNIVHVKDDKYNIDTVLFFDVTGDSKKKDEDNYLSKYNFFGLTLANANYLMSEDLYEYFEHDYDYDDYFKYEDIFEFAIKGSFNNLLDTISETDKTDANKVLEEIKRKFTKEILIKDFALALYNVREVEYDSYVIDKVDLKEIKTSILTRFTNLLTLRGKRMGLSDEEIHNIILELDVELCLNIFPLLDDLEFEKKKKMGKKKLLLKEEENS